MNLLWFLLYTVSLVSSQLTVDIVYSYHTNLDFVLNLTSFLKQTFQSQIEFYLIYANGLEDSYLAIDNPDVVFDLTFSASISQSIKKIAEEKNFIIASIDKVQNTYSRWEFFIHNSWKNHMEALSSIISYFNWETFIVISDETHDEDVFFDYFSNKNFNLFFFSNNNNDISADLLIGKAIQATGIKNIIILNQGESTNLLLKSLDAHNLLTRGTGVIIGSEGVWDLYGNGVIAYTESGLENSGSYYSYEGLAFIKFLNQILKFSSRSDSLSLLELLNENTIDHHPISNFTLLNTKNKQKVISGTIFNQNLSILNNLTFPGNSSAIPNSPTTNINIWLADGSTNPGQAPNYYLSVISTGEYFALNLWKNTHALDGFNITVTHTDCGVTTYDKAYGVLCFSKLLSTPGVGFLTSPYAFMTLPYIYTLRYLNFSIPNISPFGPSSLNTNYTAFPEFMTVAKGATANTRVLFDIALIFNWKNFIVLYDDNNIEGYNYFLQEIENFGMNIVNSIELRKMDAYYTIDKYSLWKDKFEEIIKLKARLFVIFLTAPYWFHIVESLYDAGLRRGDAIILSNQRVAYAVIWEQDLEQRQKLTDLLYGSVVIAQAEWIGEYGETQKNDFLKQYPYDGTEFRCLAFDAAMLLLNGIKFTIEQGQNVKNYQTMNNNLRRQRFIGCSGTVSIESGGNQRSFPTIGIYNLRWDSSAKSLYEELAGIYDIGSIQLITFTSGIIWYDNSTTVPIDLIKYENGCPFPKKMISRSEKGAGVLYGISISIIILAIIGSWAIWQKFWKKIKIEKLIVPVRAHFEDYLLMIIIGIDFFQFLSQGPDISDLFPWLTKICSLSLINFNSSISKDYYWVYFYFAMILACYWIFSLFILTFSHIYFLDYARNIAIRLLPIIGNMMFLPMVSVLLSIFQCDEGISADITDSFINYDCTTYCWNYTYYKWGVFSIISLITYIPLAIYFKVYYENINEHINVRTKPIFILEKSIFQLIIVVMNKTIRVYNESLHGLCCIILLFLLIMLCFKHHPYNYNRMNLWLTIFNLAVIWSFLLSSLYWLTDFDSPALWNILQYSIWAILVLAGFFIQRNHYPSLLLDDKSTNIAIFFKFSMGSEIAADDINRIKRDVESKYFREEKKLSYEQGDLSDAKMDVSSQ